MVTPWKLTKSTWTGFFNDCLRFECSGQRRLLLHVNSPVIREKGKIPANQGLIDEGNIDKGLITSSPGHPVKINQINVNWIFLLEFSTIVFVSRKAENNETFGGKK
ncbi:uncharacterized protein LOC122508350 [Leptopilina heterotoma]|uniref:uncharacterized protein LOC122508350 n=1 Tax=Leptopilina heterotoma TaxID=63436 RepID=UPI001CA8B28A|nr:uncharacterized protein LOC122508350 [Leptopilina heterotoma]